METVETLLLDKNEIVIPVKNVLLFAGYRVSSPVPEYAARAKEIAARMHDVFTPRACYLRAPITDRGEDFIDVLGMHLISRPLAELEAPCDEVFLFAATTGPAVDREIKRSAVISPVDNVLTDAAGGAAAEAACDAVDAQATPSASAFPPATASFPSPASRISCASWTPSGKSVSPLPPAA